MPSLGVIPLTAIYHLHISCSWGRAQAPLRIVTAESAILLFPQHARELRAEQLRGVMSPPLRHRCGVQMLYFSSMLLEVPLPVFPHVFPPWSHRDLVMLFCFAFLSLIGNGVLVVGEHPS